VALHSPYDPAREAERFAEAALGPETPSTVVVLGEGLGYLTRWVRGVHPSARVLKVHYSEEISRSSSSVSEADGDTWHPGLRVSVGEFLASRIGELDVEGLRMIEWPPSARLFPGLSRTANEALQQCLRELNGSLVTTISVGRLWLRNCVANFLSLGEVFRGAPCSPQRSIVITASGPSLESAAPLLREVRADVDIWALPSSAPFLREAGLKPDLLVMTDPGFFAIHHLHHAMPDCPVAMPLSAARGLWRLAAQGSIRTRSFLLEQPGLMEEVFLQALGIPAPSIAPHGTVAATAIDLARAFTTGPIILAGLDMSTRDILSHARPNEFERFSLARAWRTAPSYTFWFRSSAEQNATRVPGSGGARASLSLRTYAGWLGAQAGEKVYRLLPSAVALAGMKPLDAASLKELLRCSPPSPPGNQLSLSPALPARAQRVSMAQRILAGWRETVLAGLESAQGKRGTGALAALPLLTLAYQIAPQPLLETKRKARLGDERGARESAISLLQECEKFLRGLQERVSRAA